VEIVSEKEPATYRRILERAGIPAEDFVMVGDSARSDIEAALAAGARAVHIPGWREWEAEAADLGAPDGRWWRLATIRDLPALLDTLDPVAAVGPPEDHSSVLPPR
jgi:putative hydrolase of the HAD superfamily